MSDIVTQHQAEPPTPAPIEPISNKTDRPPRKVIQAIELMLTGACTTQKAAAERVGLTPEWLCKCLARDNARVFIERRSRQTIAAGTIRASARLNELIDASSEHVSLDATKHVLAIAGIKPTAETQVNVNIDVKAGFVIDLSEPAPLPAMKEINVLEVKARS